jgi:hypothetical protein
VNRQLQKLNAGDDVETPDLTSAQLLQSLSKNMLDLVLTGEKGTGHEDIVQYRWVCQEPLLIAMPSLHPASLKEKVASTISVIYRFSGFPEVLIRRFTTNVKATLTR